MYVFYVYTVLLSNMHIYTIQVAHTTIMKIPSIFQKLYGNNWELRKNHV